LPVQNPSICLHVFTCTSSPLLLFAILFPFRFSFVFPFVIFFSSTVIFGICKPPSFSKFSHLFQMKLSTSTSLFFSLLQNTHSSVCSYFCCVIGIIVNLWYPSCNCNSAARHDSSKNFQRCYCYFL
jgi:hypothetical protein